MVINQPLPNWDDPPSTYHWFLGPKTAGGLFVYTVLLVESLSSFIGPSVDEEWIRLVDPLGGCRVDVFLFSHRGRWVFLVQT